MSRPRARGPGSRLNPIREMIAVHLVVLVVGCLIIWLTGCGVRSVTTCLTYDRALQRPDPNTLIQRDSAGASVCVETGPKE